jgi:hypothetical protein
MVLDTGVNPFSLFMVLAGLPHWALMLFPELNLKHLQLALV